MTCLTCAKPLADDDRFCSHCGGRAGGPSVPAGAWLDDDHDRLAETEELARVGSWEWDVAADRVIWSDGLYRIHGRPLGSVNCLEDVLAGFLPENRARYQALIQHTVATGEPFAGEGVALRTDGSWITVYGRTRAERGPDGRAVRLFGTVQDVTDLRAAEQANKQLQAQLRAVIETTSDPVYIRTLDGRYLLMNPAGARQLGLTPDQVVGRHVQDLIPPDLADQALAGDRRIAETGETYAFEIELPTAEGPRSYALKNDPYRGPDGSIIGVVGIGREITERKHLERTLQAQNRQLQSLDAVKTELVDTISHELRTPLTFIKGFAEFLEDGIGGPLTDAQGDYVAQIRKGTDWLQRLVDDLLDAARIEAGTFRLALEEGDMAARVHECLGHFRPQADEAHIRLRAEVADVPTRVRFDAVRIGQVLGNLLQNALKFTPEGGEIVVRLARVEDALKCEVKDSGCGIAPADVPKLFNRFVQLDQGNGRRPGGTGLGLSIARTIIEAHAGAIGVESEVGEGTTFWFTLPAAGGWSKVDIPA